MQIQETRIAERRSSSYRLIESLVKERNEMLVLFNQLASKQRATPGAETTTLLERFCEALIDYTADAHFRLYRYIDERKERRNSVLKIADEVYPRIVKTTQAILDFNDKYDSAEHPVTYATLSQDLSKLGLELANRIELEDRVIDSLDRDRVSQSAT